MKPISMLSAAVVAAAVSVSLAIPFIAATPSSCEAHDYYAVASRGTTAAAVADSGRIIYSTQGPHVTWFGTQAPQPVDFRAITNTADGYVAVGKGGRVYRNADGLAIAWTSVSSRTTQDLFGVAKMGQRLAAVGDSGTIILGSLTEDQFPWNHADSVATGNRLRAVAGGQTYSVAVGDAGTVLYTPSGYPTIWRLVPNIPTQQDLRGVAEGPNYRFWAVGANGTLLRSVSNPADAWEVLPSGTTENLNAITFFGMTGIAVGDNGTILYSNGGQVWTRVDAPDARNLFGVSYTGSGMGGGFVAVGQGAAIIWSQLGTNWQTATVPVRTVRWGSIRQGWRRVPGR